MLYPGFKLKIQKSRSTIRWILIQVHVAGSTCTCYLAIYILVFSIVKHMICIGPKCYKVFKNKRSLMIIVQEQWWRLDLKKTRKLQLMYRKLFSLGFYVHASTMWDLSLEPSSWWRKCELVFSLRWKQVAGIWGFHIFLEKLVAFLLYPMPIHINKQLWN